MRYSISYWCTSHQGKVRSMNQDNFICDGKFMEINDSNINLPLLGEKTSKDFFVVGIFDGMGGEQCGEIASYIAAKDASYLRNTRNGIAMFDEFCENANMDICDYAKEQEIDSMGTTAAMLAFAKDEIILCNIGDTKIFRFSEDGLEQISEDHLAFSAYGKKPPLSQCLGIPPTEMIIEPYVAEGGYIDQDLYLICSDGLTDMVSNDEISEVLGSMDLEEAGETLLEKALENGGRDNISIILCKIKEKSTWFSGL